MQIPPRFQTTLGHTQRDAPPACRLSHTAVPHSRRPAPPRHRYVHMHPKSHPPPRPHRSMRAMPTCHMSIGTCYVHASTPHGVCAMCMHPLPMAPCPPCPHVLTPPTMHACIHRAPRIRVTLACIHRAPRPSARAARRIKLDSSARSAAPLFAETRPPPHRVIPSPNNSISRPTHR